MRMFKWTNCNGNSVLLILWLMHFFTVNGVDQQNNYQINFDPEIDDRIKIIKPFYAYSPAIQNPIKFRVGNILLVKDKDNEGDIAVNTGNDSWSENEWICRNDFDKIESATQYEETKEHVHHLLENITREESNEKRSASPVSSSSYSSSEASSFSLHCQKREPRMLKNYKKSSNKQDHTKEDQDNTTKVKDEEVIQRLQEILKRNKSYPKSCDKNVRSDYVYLYRHKPQLRSTANEKIKGLYKQIIAMKKTGSEIIISQKKKGYTVQEKQVLKEEETDAINKINEEFLNFSNKEKAAEFTCLRYTGYSFRCQYWSGSGANRVKQLDISTPNFGECVYRAQQQVKKNPNIPDRVAQRIPKESEESNEINKINETFKNLSGKEKAAAYNKICYTHGVFKCIAWDKHKKKDVKLTSGLDFGKCVYKAQQTVKNNPNPNLPDNIAQLKFEKDDRVSLKIEENTVMAIISSINIKEQNSLTLTVKFESSIPDYKAGIKYDIGIDQFIKWHPKTEKKKECLEQKTESKTAETLELEGRRVFR